ncbi:MAG: hypothetical protein A2X94_17385 [Bdellovibrionales bacterium GWB1_55_8]|nr:MAG: hypothetical protein A2X94_17385 [Bdellovibrionales bacterium GWB1_55_8]
MTYQLAVLGKDLQSETLLAERLSRAAAHVADVRVSAGSDAAVMQSAQIIFVDGTGDDPSRKLAGLDRSGRAIFLVLNENASIPKAWTEGAADGVLLYPFRPLEILSNIQKYEQKLLWDEVTRLNTSFSELLSRLQGDLQVAERLQKSKLPVRFPEIKGFQVTTRYLAGMRSGGDHFDLAESPDKNTIAMVLSDSSSYGLSSAVLSVLMRVMVKLSFDEKRSSSDTVRKIQEELLATLGEKDRLSLFYGVLSRKDYRLRYTNLGSSSAFYSGNGGAFRALASASTPISRAAGPDLVVSESELVLEPQGRLLLVSDGFVEAAGGSGAFAELIERFREAPPADMVNELVFKVKSAFEEPDDMPAQDCTATVFDVDSRLIRLA